MPCNLFTPLNVGSVQVKNRILMAPMTRARAGPLHVPTDLMKEYYTQRASAGLIIAEATMIMPKTSAFIAEAGIYSDQQLAAWRDITEAVHAKGGNIFIQLWHAGRVAHPDMNDGVECVGPSAIAAPGEAHTLQGKTAYTIPRALTVDGIKAITERFATAAKNAIQVAGFDGVEVHCANGYLLDQFLHTCANTRTDQYGGGSLENRSRFLAEVLEAVTTAVGADKVGVRFSTLGSHGWTAPGDVFELSEHVAKLAQRFDVAYVHILRRDFLNVLQGDIEPIFRKHFKNVLISNMGYTKVEANAAIEDGRVDAVSFGALFVANPDLPDRFKLDSALTTPDPATYFTRGRQGYTDYPRAHSSDSMETKSF